MIFQDRPGSSTFLKTVEGAATIASGPISVSTVRDAGVFINGPVSISSNINNFKMAGIYRFNPMLSTGIPSTMITPMPVLTLDLPLKNASMLGGIAKIMTSLLG